MSNKKKIKYDPELHATAINTGFIDMLEALVDISKNYQVRPVLNVIERRVRLLQTMVAEIVNGVSYDAVGGPENDKQMGILTKEVETEKEEI